VKLMAKLIFLPIANEIESGTYLLYDGACGTGGMLTVAEDIGACRSRSGCVQMLVRNRAAKSRQ
jgi:hypothetical protein